MFIIQANDYTRSVFSAQEMLPACGQGTIGIEFLETQTDIRDLLSQIHDVETGYCMSAERGALRALDGSCRTPVGAYARRNGGHNGDSLTLTVSVVRLDGTKIWTETSTCVGESDHDFDQFGFALGLKIKDLIDPDILL